MDATRSVFEQCSGQEVPFLSGVWRPTESAPPPGETGIPRTVPAARTPSVLVEHNRESRTEPPDGATGSFFARLTSWLRGTLSWLQALWSRIWERLCEAIAGTGPAQRDRTQTGEIGDASTPVHPARARPPAELGQASQRATGSAESLSARPVLGAQAFASTPVDPAAGWRDLVATLDSTLKALQTRTDLDAPAQGFTEGLMLVANQMEAAAPQVAALRPCAAQEAGRPEALCRALQEGVLPVAANLYRAHKALQNEPSQTPALAALRTLAAVTCGQLAALLGRWDVHVLDPLGKRFDPKEHEALVQTAEEHGQPGHVSVVYQPGFRLGPHLLQAAQVGVVRARGRPAFLQ